MSVARDWNPPAAFPFGRFEGSPRDVGRGHGRAFGEQVRGSIRVHRASIEKTGLAWPEALVWSDRARETMKLIEPKLAEELEGVAEGAEVDHRELFAINFRVSLSRLAAQPVKAEAECTTGVITGEATADGHTLLAQNWDQNSELQANLVVIEQKIAGEPALLFVTEAGRLFLHGMNDAGVGVVGNALTCDLPTQPERTLMWGGRRRALRHTTFAAAYRSMIDAPTGTSGNHLLADSTGAAADIEAIPGDFFTLEPKNGVLAHSNHYLSPKAKDVIVDVGLAQHPNSLHREERLRTQLTDKLGRITVDDVKEALRDHFGHPTSVCVHPHPNGRGGTGHTLSSTVMDLNARKLFNAPGPTCLGTYTEYTFS